MTTKVLITGGAGFLGRGILRRIARGDLDWDVTVYSRGEGKQDECRHRYPDARYVLGDVRDLDRLTLACAGHDLILHTAAMKRIPEAEVNAAECFAVNIDGSRNVAKAALWAGVRRVIGISTDKAVQPVNAYGCSKMAMERLFAELSTVVTELVCVRYGNVIGSTGSVIPLFRRQVQESGKVQLTDPTMTRFWMSIEEAVDTILLATRVVAGAIAIPHARAMKLSDVVLAAVGEVPVDLIGERPGEKKHEVLLHYEESVRVMRYDKHFELLPVGLNAGNLGTLPFTLASHTPHYWMHPDEMRELAADAESV